jgi:hypothetical protein
VALASVVADQIVEEAPAIPMTPDEAMEAALGDDIVRYLLGAGFELLSVTPA